MNVGSVKGPAKRYVSNARDWERRYVFHAVERDLRYANRAEPRESVNAPLALVPGWIIRTILAPGAGVMESFDVPFVPERVKNSVIPVPERVEACATGVTVRQVPFAISVTEADKTHAFDVREKAKLGFVALNVENCPQYLMFGNVGNLL